MELLTNHLLANPDISGQGNMQPLVNMWLVNQVACYRKKPYRAGEWTSQVIAHFEDSESGIESAHPVFRKCRDILIAYCLENTEAIPVAAVYEHIVAAADAHDAHLIEYSIKRIQEQETAERRQRAMIAEAATAPLALLNAQGFIETANRAFARCLATPTESLVGRDMLALCDEQTAGRMRTALRHRSSSKQRRTFTGALQEGKEKVNARFHVQQLFDASGLRAGMAVYLETDVKNELATNAGIQYFEDYFLSMIPLPLQLCTEDGVPAYSSPELSNVAPAAYNNNEPLCCFLYRRSRKGQHACPCREAFSTGRFHMEEVCYADAGETRWFLLIILPVPEQCGRIARTICCVYDMTRRKQLQKQLETEIITQQRSSLTAQLAVTVAHQLRNPLSVVLGFAEMLAKGLPPDQTHEAVTRVLRNALRCKDIVEGLLDFGKGMPLEQRMLDFATLIRESVRPMLTPSQNRMITWRLAKQPTPIECVPEQLVQVVLSLLDNALHAAESEVVCTLEKKGSAVRLRVIDDGPGIAPEIRERIFEPFFTTRREAGAVGLGLSLGRAVANDYGGSLNVSTSTGSEPGGACFTLQLPLAEQLTDKDAPKKRGKKNAQTPPAPERRVLVVDDEADLLELMKTALYTRGYLADTVASGAAAMEMLATNTYDAVVIDFLLTGPLSGADVYEHICAEQPELRERVFFITADTLNYKTRMFLEKTGRPFLEKPFLMADFISELQRVTAG